MKFIIKIYFLYLNLRVRVRVRVRGIDSFVLKYDSHGI